jgi:hypothetical protein
MSENDKSETLTGEAWFDAHYPDTEKYPRIISAYGTVGVVVDVF